ncbi:MULTISPECIES: ArgP/LysG family DNA-binding transcriptional regulator [Brevibacterium]|uniref:LysR family transcriptional regulator ArgP n=1 Tax=Brevibacterium salitolerans TaxID=1403566 RepID=A0ABP5IEF3_9MICO|nr:ArgP/LysG family DNA-binding transcriptional regulator [Brevibacterium sp.]
MEPSLAQLAALVAVVDEGAFDSAATALGVTTSAVSQRVRGLERSLGSVLLTRSSPPRVTDAGERILGHARQIVALAGEITAAEAPARSALAVAVGADALGTWLEPVLADAGRWEDVVLRLRVADQDVAHEALARGEVMGALSTRTQAQTGCTAVPLGILRYWPCVSAELWERHGGLATCPVLVFDGDDDLQHQVLRRQDAGAGAPLHVVGSMEGFAAAVRAGLGWGCLPELQLARMDDTGDIMRIPGEGPVDVPLHWHRWATPLPALDRFTDSLRGAAAGSLRAV